MAAKFGILARGGGEAFQEMSAVDVVVFDKTGTLTYGSDPKVTNFELASGLDLSKLDILSMSAELENGTSHPLAIAIRDYCGKEGARTLRAEDYHEEPGRGLRATFPDVNGRIAIIGNEAWMNDHQVLGMERLIKFAEDWKKEGKSIVMVAVQESNALNFCTAAVFAVADVIRPEAPDVIKWMRQHSISTWMISGDNFTTASAVAAMIGIEPSNVIAGVLPQEKVRASTFKARIFVSFSFL